MNPELEHALYATAVLTFVAGVITLAVGEETFTKVLGGVGLALAAFCILAVVRVPVFA